QAKRGCVPPHVPDLSVHAPAHVPPFHNHQPPPTHTHRPLPESQRGPAERLLDVVLGSGAHLWHNRPGIDDGGVWRPAVKRRRGDGTAAAPGLFVPAAVDLYRKLLDIHQLNADLMAHFASYAVLETEWRDLKVACAALMLVQSYAGQPVRGEGGTIEFSRLWTRPASRAQLVRSTPSRASCAFGRAATWVGPHRREA